MDLTAEHPRSPRERLAGMSMLPRTIDKARAAADGTLGDYIYDCPMDKQLFAVLGIERAAFVEIVRQAKDDAAVVSVLRGRDAMPDAQSIAAHNAAIESWAPKSDKGRAHFIEQRTRIAPDRSDVVTWTDLLDLEEGRPLPASR